MACCNEFTPTRCYRCFEIAVLPRRQPSGNSLPELFAALPRSIRQELVLMARHTELIPDGEWTAEWDEDGAEGDWFITYLRGVVKGDTIQLTITVTQYEDDGSRYMWHTWRHQCRAVWDLVPFEFLPPDYVVWVHKA